jgi:hypothetical protein
MLVRGEKLSPLRSRRLRVKALEVLVWAIDGAAVLTAHKHSVQR